jgi:hypothetical protein
MYLMKSYLVILSFILLIGIPFKSLSTLKLEMRDDRNHFAVLPDTIIYRQIEEIKVYPQNEHKISTNQYDRMVRKIRKVYPFAREAALELQLYNEKFKTIDSRQLRRQYLKKVEKELFIKHADDMKHLTISEGRYLMLLIDRETGETSFELVKELKGSFSAIFWQGIAKIFSNDLKEEYDPINEHFMIEQIVLMIEKEKS